MALLTLTIILILTLTLTLTLTRRPPVPAVTLLGCCGAAPAACALLPIARAGARSGGSHTGYARAHVRSLSRLRRQRRYCQRPDLRRHSQPCRALHHSHRGNATRLATLRGELLSRSDALDARCGLAPWWWRCPSGRRRAWQCAGRRRRPPRGIRCRVARPRPVCASPRHRRLLLLGGGGGGRRDSQGGGHRGARSCRGADHGGACTGGRAVATRLRHRVRHGGHPRCRPLR